MDKVLFDANLSRFKVVIYLLNRERCVFYSLIEEDKKNPDRSLSGMVRRLLLDRYRKKYNTALVYDNGSLIQKYVKGVREL